MLSVSSIPPTLAEHLEHSKIPYMWCRSGFLLNMPCQQVINFGPSLGFGFIDEKAGVVLINELVDGRSRVVVGEDNKVCLVLDDGEAVALPAAVASTVVGVAGKVSLDEVSSDGGSWFKSTPIMGGKGEQHMGKGGTPRMSGKGGSWFKGGGKGTPRMSGKGSAVAGSWVSPRLGSQDVAPGERGSWFDNMPSMDLGEMLGYSSSEKVISLDEADARNKAQKVEQEKRDRKAAKAKFGAANRKVGAVVRIKAKGKGKPKKKLSEWDKLLLSKNPEEVELGRAMKSMNRVGKMIKANLLDQEQKAERLNFLQAWYDMKTNFEEYCVEMDELMRQYMDAGVIGAALPSLFTSYLFGKCYYLFISFIYSQDTRNTCWTNRRRGRNRPGGKKQARRQQTRKRRIKMMTLTRLGWLYYSKRIWHMHRDLQSCRGRRVA